MILRINLYEQYRDYQKLSLFSSENRKWTIKAQYPQKVGWDT